LDVECVSGDVTDLSSLLCAFAGVEVVYNVAGHISVRPGEEGKLRAVNVEGARTVVEACLDRRVRRLVHFSSIYALASSPSDRSIDECRPLAADASLPAYDRSKAAGEIAVADGVARGLDAVIVNPTGIIGPIDFRPSRMGRFFLDLCLGRLPAVVRGGFNWVDVRDVVSGAMAAEERGRTGERYILGGHWSSLRDLALLAGQATDAVLPSFEAPMALARFAAPFVTRWARLRGTEAIFTTLALHALRHHEKVSWAKAAHELGYRARPAAETVEATLAWFRGAGMLPDASLSAGDLEVSAA
jgi:dihydroflavonol-4-reductase